MSLCHLDQVVTGLPAEERLLEAVVVRLVVTEAERQRPVDSWIKDTRGF
jgi:hypothetical protein